MDVKIVLLMEGGIYKMIPARETENFKVDGLKNGTATIGTSVQFGDEKGTIVAFGSKCVSEFRWFNIVRTVGTLRVEQSGSHTMPSNGKNLICLLRAHT